MTAAAAVALVAAATMVAASLKNQARLVSQQLHQPVNQTGGRVGPHSGCLFLKIVKKLNLVFSLLKTSFFDFSKCAIFLYCIFASSKSTANLNKRYCRYPMFFVNN